MPEQLKTIGSYTTKEYKCARCGNKKPIGTNHWGECYSICEGCSWKNPMDPMSVWECMESCPEGYTKPEPWKKVKLGDIADIKKVN